MNAITLRCLQPWLGGILGRPVVPAHQPRQLINGIQPQRSTVKIFKHFSYTSFCFTSILCHDEWWNNKQKIKYPTKHLSNSNFRHSVIPLSIVSFGPLLSLSFSSNSDQKTKNQNVNGKWKYRNYKWNSRLTFFLGLCHARFLNVFSIPEVSKVLSLAFLDHPLHIHKFNSSCESVDNMLVLCRRMMMRAFRGKNSIKEKSNTSCMHFWYSKSFLFLHWGIHTAWKKWQIKITKKK